MKKTILQLLFLFCLSLPLTFGQTTDGGSFWNKLGIGAGYNFLNNSGFPDDREKLLTSLYLSCRWSIDLRTNIRFTWWFLSMWLTAVKNGNTIRLIISFPVCIASGERNSDIIYIVFDWKGIHVFRGMVFSYLHSKRDIKYLTEWDGNKWTDHFFWRKSIMLMACLPKSALPIGFNM